MNTHVTLVILFQKLTLPQSIPNNENKKKCRKKKNYKGYGITQGKTS